MSQDPMGFAAGDANLYRYVGNGPTNGVDPTGLAASPNVPGPGQTTPYMPDYGYSGGSPPSPVLSDNTGADWLDLSANFFAGWGDSLTAGLTSRIRTDVGINDGIDTSSSSYSTGSIVGTVHGVVLAFVSPCQAGQLATALRVLIAVQATGSFINGVELAGQGNYGSAALSFLSTLGSISQLGKACFAAGTPILTPDGAKSIERFKVGDWVLSAPEDDPEAPAEPRLVEEVFQTYAPLLNLRIGGKMIRTTAEHPFWVRGRGWTTAHQLMAGDHMRSHDGRWLVLEAVEGEQEAAPVYNLRVAEYHTYFVGGSEWGFSVWAHNAYEVGTANELRKTAQAKTQVHHVPQSREAETLVGNFNLRNHVGNEPAIRLPTLEHEAVNAAQKSRDATASARDLLASEIRILRNSTNAPNPALQELIQLNKDTHYWDYLK